jgi:hypothetical protein
MAQGEILSQLAQSDATMLQGVNPPSNKVVEWFHGRADTTRPESIHHPIGTGPSESAAGDHTHNGKDSAFIIPAGTTLTDVPTTATNLQLANAINAINAVLTKLGANQ